MLPVLFVFQSLAARAIPAVGRALLVSVASVAGSIVDQKMHGLALAVASRTSL